MKQSNQSANLISCEDAIKRVFDYIDGELHGKPREELEHHLEACRHCFDRVQFERALKSRLSSLKVDSNPEALRARIETLLDRF